MITHILARASALTLLWYILAAGDPASWLMGGPAIVLFSVWRVYPWRPPTATFRPWGLLTFIPFFVWRSFAGSCDVAWRALHWRLPIAPTVCHYSFRLPPEGPARVCYVNLLSLLPGTLAATWNGQVLQVHILANEEKSRMALRQLEERVASIFGHPLDLPQQGDAS